MRKQEEARRPWEQVCRSGGKSREEQGLSQTGGSKGAPSFLWASHPASSQRGPPRPISRPLPASWLTVPAPLIRTPKIQEDLAQVTCFRSFEPDFLDTIPSSRRIRPQRAVTLCLNWDRLRTSQVAWLQNQDGISVPSRLMAQL